MARKRSYVPTKWAVPRADQPARVVKSAARILEVLEFIDDIGRSVNLAETAEALDLPLSSASALLHTLEELGYLHLNRKSGTYLPTCRIAMLGVNAASGLLRAGALFKMLADIQSHTSQHVVLAARHGCHAQYVYATQPANPDQGLLYNGLLVPLPVCGAGIALLSALPDEQIWGLLSPLYANAEYRGSMMPMPDLMELLKKARMDGYVYFNNTLYSEGATLAMVLPVSDHGHPIVAGVAGNVSELGGQKDRLLVFMREAITRYGMAR